MNTAGFYSYQNDRLYYAPELVSFVDGCLVAEAHDQYEYPVNDWTWFDSEEQAKAAFGVA
jgi:hypothetical protein